MSDTVVDLPASPPGGPLPFSAGDHIGGYRVLGLLGGAASDPVYEVEHDSQQGRRVMRLLRAGASVPVDGLRGWLAAAKALSEDHNRHLPLVFEVIEPGGPGAIAGLVMELVSGRSLAQLLAEEAPLPGERIVFLLAQVLDALGALHRVGLGHGALAPEAVLVIGPGTDDAVKLLGFDRIGSAPVESGTDIAAFGVLLQALLSTESGGRSGDPLRPSLAAIARRCLAGQSPEGWSSIGELKEVFDSLLCGETGGLAGLGDDLDLPPERPNRGRWRLALPLAALVVVGGGILFWRAGGAPATPAPEPAVASSPAAPPRPPPPPSTPSRPATETPAPMSAPAAAPAPRKRPAARVGREGTINPFAE